MVKRFLNLRPRVQGRLPLHNQNKGEVMPRVAVRAYTSPTLVLLAFDWAEGQALDDFLGFAIRRMPGFSAEDASWLPNRIGFSGPVKKGHADLPSHEAPIQKFMWWDARIDAGSSGKKFTYAVIPVRGSPAHPTLIGEATAEVEVTVPHNIENGIGTWFNRAVVSSQAFSLLAASLGVTTSAKPPRRGGSSVTHLVSQWLGNRDSELPRRSAVCREGCLWSHLPSHR